MNDIQERVQQTIDGLVASGREIGVQVAVYRDGEQLVDAVAGTADTTTGAPVTPDTLFPSFSTGKGVAATLIHVLAERGLLTYDTTIASLWPEFAAHGKGSATIRHALTHSIGVPGLPENITPEDLCDWDHMRDLVANAEPWWEPGTATGYHGWTFGWIIGEIIRRTSGQSIAEALHQEIALPLGIAGELYFGVPTPELPRLARLEEGNWAWLIDNFLADGPFAKVAPKAVRTTADLANRPDIQQADLLSCGSMSARAVARMYAALLSEVDGVRLVSPQRLTELSSVATREPDRIFGAPIPKALGYFTGYPDKTRATFGMNGSGDSLAFADPANNLTFALTKNRLSGGDQENAEAVAMAVYEGLGIA